MTALTDFWFFDKASLRMLAGPVRCLRQDSHRYAAHMAKQGRRDILYLGSDYRGVASCAGVRKKSERYTC